MKKAILICLGLLLIWALLYKTVEKGESPDMQKSQIVFATYAQDKEDLHWALVMFESVRSFAGNFKDSPLWLYLVDATPEIETLVAVRQSALGYVVKKCPTPIEARSFFFYGKVFASAMAEGEAAGRFKFLAWLDPDVVFVGQPDAFILPENVSLGCRPVMHQLIGSSYDQPPDEFWSRLYQKLDVPDSAIFPVVTPIDEARIRAYFNAGMLIVRPERGILQGWPEAFAQVYSDSVFAEWTKSDRLKAIFLHQAALAGNILANLTRAKIFELPPTYNYPLNLADKYPAARKPLSLDSLVMFRHDGVFATAEQLARVDDGSKILTWLKARLPENE